MRSSWLEMSFSQLPLRPGVVWLMLVARCIHFKAPNWCAWTSHPLCWQLAIGTMLIWSQKPTKTYQINCNLVRSILFQAYGRTSLLFATGASSSQFEFWRRLLIFSNWPYAAWTLLRSSESGLEMWNGSAGPLGRPRQRYSRFGVKYRRALQIQRLSNLDLAGLRRPWRQTTINLQLLKRLLPCWSPRVTKVEL